METDELAGIVAVAGFFAFVIVLLVVVFFIVKKILNDRHKERLAMIERGFIMSKQTSHTSSVPNDMPQDVPSGIHAEEPHVPPVHPVYRPTKPKAEDSTVKWMFILAGVAGGLLISSIVTDILYRYTLLDTDGIGFSIVVVCACLSLYIYYRRKSKKEIKQYHRELEQQTNFSEKKEEYTEE
ncbi:MAG: hypothetical protein PHD21_06230 [Flavobacteriales bacterium]|nr:hypothetical protein [Flavobacteriales bacterium]